MKVPRSKVKTDYSRLLCCLVFVVESDLSFLLTHSIFALGFVLVAGRWRATGHSRAHGPTQFPSVLDRQSSSSSLSLGNFRCFIVHHASKYIIVWV